MFSSKEMSLSPTAKAKISALLNTETCFRFREACKDHILRRGMAAIEDVAFLHTRGEEFATQKPWEVFFLDNGRLNRMRSTIPASARQLVPAAGMSIVRTLNAEEDRVIKGISMINSPEELKPAKTTARMLKKSSDVEDDGTIPEFDDLLLHADATTLQPNPFANDQGRLLPTIGTACLPNLEGLSEIVENHESDDPPPSQHTEQAFHVVEARTWISTSEYQQLGFVQGPKTREEVGPVDNTLLNELPDENTAG
ncbi:hypothetical protein UCRPC4_g03966 [Phaeomoniella chlamydospora]|uniref:Uncharacterized protein n=1 Tax=Phaeomoniella chlamydospora TaxID=158046 RepID=A0A0G2GW20_PHACM|nr:hypothetical protein UCRPC4_g03966 [Phaeomoniella chlamydospora]